MQDVHSLLLFQKGDDLYLEKCLADTIGLPAMLENTAEEATELSHACLKLARKLRGENPTPADKNDILDNLCEELADIEVMMDELYKSSDLGITRADILTTKYRKRARFNKRVKEKK